MLLSKLVNAIIAERVEGPTDIAVTGITADSRQVSPGTLFVAVRGPLSDGHAYIRAAIDAGAVAVVCEQRPDYVPAGVTVVCVPDSALALGYIASEWYGNPSRRITLVGVTGTNGKTTVATLLYEAAQHHGQRAGLLSTVENRVDNEVFATNNTTPSPLETNRLLALMVERGCTFAAMEVSSHGQVQQRTAGLHFAGGIFTNITRDHLDYHKAFSAYIAAKKSFFDSLPATAWALVNADDSHGSVMVQNTRAQVHTFAVTRPADFMARAVESRIDGTLIRVDGHDVETRFAGAFNVSNLLAVYGALRLMGYAADDAALTLSVLAPPAGRFEVFASADGVTAIVDYAHTPDALENVLATIRAVKAPTARVTTVTGAGGDRDHGKRPQMGAVAARLSERVVVTADNPRSEDPADIADDILAGIPVDSPAQVDTIAERAAAIHAAIVEAAPGDIVLIAGKGHETYQEFANRRRIHFDDRQQAQNALSERSRQ